MRKPWWRGARCETSDPDLSGRMSDLGIRRLTSVAAPTHGLRRIGESSRVTSVAEYRHRTSDPAFNTREANLLLLVVVVVASVLVVIAERLERGPDALRNGCAQ
jgi:hypothetical protein